MNEHETTRQIVKQNPARGRVYFIRAGAYVKIGFSTRPLDRLYALQVSHPEKLEILCTIAGDLEVERKMHKRFEKHHVRGEWFKLVADLDQFVDRIAHPRPVLPEVTMLLKLRTRHGARSAIGRHISVLAEALPISEDEMTKPYFVNYSIGSRAYQAGPYASYDDAETHQRDIASYAGIQECFIAEYRNPLRTLIGEEHPHS